jgi:hypothetical protein
MATGTCQSPEATGTHAAGDCACCCGDDDQGLSGGTTGKKAAVCCCGQTPQEKPAAPAGDPKHEQLEQLLSFVPVIIGILPPEATPLAAVWGHSVPTPYRPTNSIQSLLCVWTT